MFGQLNQFGAHHTGGTIIGRKGLVQLGHDAAHIGLLLHQVHLKPGVGGIQGGLDAGDAAADDGDRADFFRTLIQTSPLFSNQLYNPRTKIFSDRIYRMDKITFLFYGRKVRSNSIKSCLSCLTNFLALA